MVSLVLGQSMAILTDGSTKETMVDSPSTQTRFPVLGGMMDTRVISTNGLCLLAATSDTATMNKQPRLMRPILMTIRPIRLTHRKESPAIQAYNVLKA